MYTGPVTLASAGREWEHLYFIFELKSVVRLPGHFAGLFAGRIYVWELTILLILLPCNLTRLFVNACIGECREALLLCRVCCPRL